MKQESIDRLVQLSKELNAASDELNARIEALENGLIAMRLGVSVWIPMCEGEELGFGKLDGRWRLLAKDFNNGDVTALLEAPRIVRIAAAKSFDTLLDKLLIEAQQQLESVSRAVVTIKLLLDSKD